jgi:peptidyl-prolyl cis-trans isomerase D
MLAKMMGTKQMPDSIKCRHILVKIADKNGQMREDSVARKLIDSIAAAVKTGADFDALVLKYSDDEGSRNNKGEYKFSSSSTLVDSFYNTVFYNPTGTKKIVKGQSQDYIGYHYVEVLDQWKFAPAYKIAFLAKEILPSDATIQNANLNATKLSAQKNAKELEAYIVKNGLQRVTLPTLIKENDFSVGQMQDARQLVRWVFEAKKGDVSEPFNIGEQFVVATVDKIQSEGTQDATTARPMVEGVIRNEKKAETIIKKLGTGTTLEAAAAAYGKQIEMAGADSSLTFSSQMIANIGDEPKLIGASFNKENQAKVSAPIAGNSGVYVIKVNSIGTKSIDTPAAATQKLSTLRSQVGAGWFEGLKNQATIKDNRSKYY